MELYFVNELLSNEILKPTISNFFKFVKSEIGDYIYFNGTHYILMKKGNKKNLKTDLNKQEIQSLIEIRFLKAEPLEFNLHLIPHLVEKKFQSKIKDKYNLLF